MGELTRASGRAPAMLLPSDAMSRAPSCPPRRVSSLWVPIGLLVLGLTGCVEVTDFDPVGTTSHISGLWTIDGAPPTAESCQALGATRVHVTFLDGLRPVAHSSLFFLCSAPSGFNTLTPEAGDPRPVIGEGSWTMRLDAIDSSDNLVADGPVGNRVAPDADSVLVVPSADFLTAILHAELTLDGQTPTYESCEGAGISTLRLSYVDEGGAGTGSHEEPCALGAVGERVLPAINYQVQVIALDSGGTIVAQSAPESILIESGAQAQVGGGPIELTAL